MSEPMDAEKMPIFDGHNDTLLHLYSPERGAGRSFYTRSDEGHLDLPRAREGGFSGGFFAIFVPAAHEDPTGPFDPERTIKTAEGYEVEMDDPIDPEYAYRYADEMITFLYQLEAEGEGAVQVVREAGELDDCLKRGVLSMVLHFEGAEAIDARLRNLEAFYERGLRSVGIVWSRPNAFGWGVPFKFPTSPDIGPGLTHEGKELVHVCNELGIVLDLAHLNEQGFWDVARRTDAPLVVTHSAAHALSAKSRNLTDKQLDAVADTDGVVGVTFTTSDLRADGQLDTDAPLTEIVRHIDYIAQRIGVEHVAIGSDFDGTTVPKEIGDVTGLPKLVQALRERGFDEDALRKVAHENWFRVIGETWHR
jgi:membrane dipeptidase